MQVCYIDESGDTGKFVPEVANSQPLFVLSGIVVDQQVLPEMTCSVIELKRKFFPNHGSLNTHWHDWLKSEVKGSCLRKMGGVRILSGANRKVNPLDIFGEPPTGR